MAKLFVSYSRKDSIAARKLIEEFKSMDQDVWVDWEAIPPAVDWLEQIFRGIEAADAFIFMISPDSITSEVCKVEVNRAVLNNKRIIPIVLRDVNPRDTQEEIRRLNWTYIRDTDNLEEGLAKVRTAIELDLDWLEEHRRLQVRALEWHRKKDPSLLLRGRDLRNARHMLQTFTSKDPTPTELQLKYIDFSQRTQRTQTIMIALTVVTLIVMIALTLFAQNQSNIAQQQRGIAEGKATEANNNKIRAEQNAMTSLANANIASTQRAIASENEKLAEDAKQLAEAQRSAARAQIYQGRTGELYTSTLLAIDSWRKSSSPEAEEILRHNINLLPIPVTQISQNGSINVLALNPNGDTFLSVSADGSVCVRHVTDGKEIFCETYPTAVNDAIFVRDGASIAIAEQSGVVHVLDAESGELERDIEGRSAPRDLDSARKGQTLAIGKQDGNITILDINEPDNQADNFFLSGGNLAMIDFSPNGQWLAAGSQRGNTAIWNLNTKQSPFNVGHKAAVLALQFSPSNRFLLSGGADNSAIGFDIQLKDEAFWLPHLDWVTDIEFPSGESGWFVTASDDTRIKVWDLATAQERLTMFQDGPVKDATISADKKWIAATGDDRTVRVWSAYSGVEMYQIPLKAQGTTVAFSNDDQYLISGDADGHLDLWDISGLTSPLGYTEMSKLALISKFTPTGNQLIVSDSNQVWALNQPNVTQLAASLPASPIFDPPQGNIRDIVISPDSQSMAVSTDGGEYYVQNLQSRRFERVIPSGGADASALAYSSDGSLLITGSNDGTLGIWDINNGEGTANKTNVGTAIYSLATSPANVAVGLADKILLYDSNATEKTGELQAPGENRYLVFNADGSMLTAVNSAGQIQTWKMENGEFKALDPVIKEPAYSIALNPTGDLLALAAANNVYLIDTLHSREVSRIPHKGIVYNVSFSPDGKTLATASQKTVQFWDTSKFPRLTMEDPIQAACSRLTENFSQTQWTALFGNVQYEKFCESLPQPQ